MASLDKIIIGLMSLVFLIGCQQPRKGNGGIVDNGAKAPKPQTDGNTIPSDSGENTTDPANSRVPELNQQVDSLYAAVTIMNGKHSIGKLPVFLKTRESSNSHVTFHDTFSNTLSLKLTLTDSTCSGTKIRETPNKGILHACPTDDGQKVYEYVTSAGDTILIQSILQQNILDQILDSIN